MHSIYIINSIKYIYSSHFFEHISDDCATNLFKEVKRVLRADGLLRIVVPNFELLHQSLIHEDRTLMDSIGFRGPAADRRASPAKTGRRPGNLQNR